jgi:TPR repeat protein
VKGYLHKRGGSGILRDLQEALHWFKKGAEAGDIFAQVGQKRLQATAGRQRDVQN